ncbi:formate--phosphoribosylaminoimidazolecarboxamide ligase family protein [Candidatus Micrarchaeota archaeon]|nr:formate--phosphoribosylaminoimidazolecarboxamide ligase family protein [Candidatus Micrarchaeota archaeon]
MKISTLGSHSALDVSEGAKKEGFGTLVVCKKGRERTYAKHYKTREVKGETLGVVDEIILLDEFRDMVKEEVQEKLKGSVFIPNRSFSVYVGYDNIEKNFKTPIFGNKYLLRAEERDVPNNQYDLLEKAGVPLARTFKPEEIDTLALVKVQEAKRNYERAFFFASSYGEYQKKSEELISKGIIKREDLEKARIEEFILGAQFNFNFFYSPLSGELELLGIDTRRQTNLDGFLRLPADVQLEALKYRRVTTIETGHISATLRESLLEKVFNIAEPFVETVKKYYPKGLIGPFALQGAVEEKDGKERIVIFDVSFRMPGSPGTRFTPYSEYLYGRSVSFGRRVAIEIKRGIEEDRLEEIIS